MKNSVSMTHAWLIITHNEFEILQRLVSELDCSENTLFVHFDKKVRHIPTIQAEHASVKILSARVDVRWGSVSQIQCELTLLKTALGHGNYDFYHIISGTTLPLVSNKELLSFFTEHSGDSILTPIHKDLPYQETLKIHRINRFLRYYSCNGIKGRISQLLWRADIALQKMLGIEVNKEGDFYKSSNWLSLSGEAAKYIVSKEAEILRTYKHTFCGDEYFIPTTLMASPLKDKIVNCQNYLLCDIQRSTSAVFSLKELDAIKSSGYFFARKFSSR